MIALREGAKVLEHEHFHSGILEVQSKKKNDQFVRSDELRLAWPSRPREAEH